MAAGVYCKFSTKGDFKKAFKFLDSMRDKAFLRSLPKYGEEGVEALKEATPKRTGVTAASWHYRIETRGDKTFLVWYNTNISQDWFNVAIMIQYGHATKNGGWVKGIDYINPALAPIFDKIAKNVEEEVKKA